MRRPPHPARCRSILGGTRNCCRPRRNRHACIAVIVVHSSPSAAVTTLLLFGAIVHSVMSSEEDERAMGEMLAVSETFSIRCARALRRSVLDMRSPRSRGGSFPCRARNVARDFNLGAISIMRDYFGWA